MSHRAAKPQGPLALLVASLIAALVLAGCGSGSKGDATGGDDSEGGTMQPVASGDPDTWPLTGLPAEDGQKVAKDHPVLVVKIDNTADSAPQQGLGSADLVVEAMVEGGVTRLAAFYYSVVPDKVGPVRSVRASDIGIVTPVDAVVVTSGMAQVTSRRIDEAGITWYTEGAKGFYRDSGRYAPYNLFTNLAETATLAETDKPGRPADYLPWGEEGDFPQGEPATALTASFSGRHSTDWTYTGGGYVNDNSYAADGDEFPADTVLVLRVTVGDAGYRDPAGNPVPETKFTGKGQALIFHGGEMVRAQWTKDSLDAPLKLTSEAGEDLTIPAGRTWIELVPQTGGTVRFTP